MLAPEKRACQLTPRRFRRTEEDDEDGEHRLFERPQPAPLDRRPERRDEHPALPSWVPKQWSAAAPISGRTGTVDGTAALPAAVPEEHSSGAGPATYHLEARETPLAMDWPDRSYLELGAIPGAVPCARLHARQMVQEWGLPELAQPVEQVVSDLVTNGVQASKGLTASRFLGQWVPGVPPVRLWLASDKQRVLIQVWDGDHRLPLPQEIDDLGAESGRGLLLVQAFSGQYGVYRLEGASGKVVWGIIVEP